jgi:hypothetical protein
MDDRRFDTVARSLAERDWSRRRLSRTFTGSMLALLLSCDAPGAGAKRKRKKKKKQTQSPVPPPVECVPSCAGRLCGDDGCGGMCGIDCTGGKTCQNGACACPGTTQDCNGSCVAPCLAPSVRNPITCGCCLAAGQACGQPGDAPCCTTSDPGCVTTCRGNADGGACQFSSRRSATLPRSALAAPAPNRRALLQRTGVRGVTHLDDQLACPAVLAS